MDLLFEKILKTNSEPSAINLDSTLALNPPLFNLVNGRNNDRRNLSLNSTSNNSGKSNNQQFNPFVSLPNNISDYGVDQNELTLLRDKPDNNPMLMQMNYPSDSSNEDKRSEIIQLKEIIQENEFPVMFKYASSKGIIKTVTLNNLDDAMNLLKHLESQLQMMESLLRVDGMSRIERKMNYYNKLVYANMAYTSKG